MNPGHITSSKVSLIQRKWPYVESNFLKDEYLEAYSKDPQGMRQELGVAG